jgi:hypothetical protein
VAGTGRLVNEAEVLGPEIIERLRRAEASDTVVRVVAHGTEAATLPGDAGRLLWRFEADSVRDVAFAVMREYAWDAARAPVGDRTGGGATEHARVDAFFRAHAIHHREAARYARHSVDFLSRFTGQPYPWPHMTVVEGGGIIGGGMEYPMITIVGDFNEQGTEALYRVIAHEIAHMWLPMMLSTNERRYALKGVLGEETFMRVYREFHRRWAFRHPYPWDLWNTVEDVAGRDLDWFWRAWYHESTEDGGRWWLDQAVESVARLPGGETRVVVRDHGWIPMPIHLRVTRETGGIEELVVPVDGWLEGRDRLEVILSAGPRVTRVEIDPARHFPDVDRRNNVWTSR